MVVWKTGYVTTLILPFYICVATGSACNSKESAPSHVLLAIGSSEEEAYSTIRITIGENTQKKDLDKTVEVLKLSVANLRKKS